MAVGRALELGDLGSVGQFLLCGREAGENENGDQGEKSADHMESLGLVFQVIWSHGQAIAA